MQRGVHVVRFRPLRVLITFKFGFMILAGLFIYRDIQIKLFSYLLSSALEKWITLALTFNYTIRQTGPKPSLSRSNHLGSKLLYHYSTLGF